jgi:hypothetical protein
MRFKQEALRLDPSLKATEEPFVWPETPEGKVGRRWFVRNGAGEVVGKGDCGNPNSVWRNAYSSLRRAAQ